MNRVDLRNEEGIGILGLTRQGASPRRRLVADLKASQPFMDVEKLKVAMVFALELKLSKTMRGLVYFVLQL